MEEWDLYVGQIIFFMYSKCKKIYFFGQTEGRNIVFFPDAGQIIIVYKNQGQNIFP